MKSDSQRKILGKGFPPDPGQIQLVLSNTSIDFYVNDSKITKTKQVEYTQQSFD